MRSSRFLQLFDALTNKEAKLFLQFSKGIYEKQQVALRLLAYLVQEKGAGRKQQDYNFEELFLVAFQQKVVGKEKRKSLLNTLSDLHLWLKSYLTFMELETNDYLKKMLFIKVLLKKKLTTLLLKNVNKLRIELETLNYDFWQPLKIIVLHHLVFFDSVSIPQKDTLSHIHSLPKQLHLFFLRAKIRYETALLELRHVYVIGDSAAPKLAPTRNRISAMTEQDPYLELYFWISKLSEENEEAHFQKVMNLFLTTSFYSNDDALEVFTYLDNFITRQTRNGNEHLVKDQLALYKYGFNTGILFQNGELRSFYFQVAVSVACYQKEFDFADRIINDYGHLLHVKNAADILQLFTTRILIGRKQFGKALILVANLSLNEVNEERLRRSYQLMCLLGLQENPTLINNYCDNYLLYLKRTKSIHQDHIESSRNFVLAVQKIIRGIPVEDIHDFVVNAKIIGYKAWLLEYLSEA